MMSEAKSKNIKITHIPITIEINPHLGIVNFPTQKYQTVLEKPTATLKNHQEEITFKSAIGREDESDEQDEEFVKKKVVSSCRVAIRSQNIKKRYFRIDIPIASKGQPTGVKSNKEKVHFILQFNQDNKGTLNVIDEVYDTQVQITNVDNQAEMSQRIKLQDARMDARRREEKIEIEEKKEKDSKKKGN